MYRDIALGNDSRRGISGSYCFSSSRSSARCFADNLQVSFHRSPRRASVRKSSKVLFFKVMLDFLRGLQHIRLPVPPAERHKRSLSGRQDMVTPGTDCVWPAFRRIDLTAKNSGKLILHPHPIMKVIPPTDTKAHQHIQIQLVYDDDLLPQNQPEKSKSLTFHFRQNSSISPAEKVYIPN